MNNLEKVETTYQWVEDKNQKFIIELKKAYDLLEEAHTAFFKKFDISYTKFNLLVILFKSPEEGLILSEIGDQMLVTKANITGLVDRLEKQGLVKRIRDEIDRRKIMAVITDKGKEFTSEIIAGYKDWVHKMMNPIDKEEMKEFLITLKKVQKIIVSN